MSLTRWSASNCWICSAIIRRECAGILCFPFAAPNKHRIERYWRCLRKRIQWALHSRPLILLLDLISVFGCAAFKWILFSFFLCCVKGPRNLLASIDSFTLLSFPIGNDLFREKKEWRRNERHTHTNLGSVRYGDYVARKSKLPANVRATTDSTTFSPSNTKSIHVSACARLLRFICWWWWRGTHTCTWYTEFHNTAVVGISFVSILDAKSVVELAFECLGGKMKRA